MQSGYYIYYDNNIHCIQSNKCHVWIDKIILNNFSYTYISFLSIPIKAY